MERSITRQPSGKRFIAIMLLATLVLVSALVAASLTKKSVSASSHGAVAANAKTVTIPIEGMSCVSCAAGVKSGLAALDGVSEVHISLEKRNALVRYDDKKLSPNNLKTKIEALGFKAGSPKEGSAP